MSHAILWLGWKNDKTGCCQEYKWAKEKLMRNFPQKNMASGGLDNPLGRIDQTGEDTGKKGIAWKREKWKEENMAVVEKLILN